jgi:hypothetical protein
MLNETEKKIIRRITKNQSDEYCEQVAASDDFARSEITAKKPQLLTTANDLVQELTFNKTRIDTALAEAQVDVALLQS